MPADEKDFEQWLGAIFPVQGPREEPFRTIYVESHVPREAWGKSFEELLGGVLVEVRNQMGHALWSPARGVSGELVNLDDRTFHRKVHHWLPLMKAMARRMLKTDFPGRFLAHLPDLKPQEGAPTKGESVAERGRS